MRKWFLKNRSLLFFILKVFVVWQLALAALIFVGDRFIPSAVHYTYSEYKENINPQFLWNRANFDGMHYLDISRKGYGLYQQDFFPFYPNLIKWLKPVFLGRDLIGGLTISWVSFYFALFVLYKLIKLDFEDEIARKTVVLLLTFPVSFFFSAIYTESLFLFLILLSFYSARQKRWLLAGIAGALASSTRLVGIFLLPALLFEWYNQGQERKVAKTSSRNLFDLIPIFLVPFGLLSYMQFLSRNYNDPLMFIHVQEFFGAGRVDDKIILIHQVFWRYFKMLLTTRMDPLYFTIWIEFLVSSLFLFLVIFSFTRKVRTSYLIFAGLSFILPTLTGTFLSMQRFALVLFPCFLAFALIKRKIFYYLWVTLGLVLLAVSIVFFTHGYWIG